MALSARNRANQINRLPWDAGEGMYIDYNFEHRAVRKYPFLMTFYPLWAGIATPAQAARVASQFTALRAGWGSPDGHAPDR